MFWNEPNLYGFNFPYKEFTPQQFTPQQVPFMMSPMGFPQQKFIPQIPQTPPLFQPYPYPQAAYPYLPQTPYPPQTAFNPFLVSALWNQYVHPYNVNVPPIYDRFRTFGF